MIKIKLFTKWNTDFESAQKNYCVRHVCFNLYLVRRYRNKKHSSWILVNSKNFQKSLDKELNL